MPSTVVGVGSEAEEAVVLLTAPPRPISRVATVVRASAPGVAYDTNRQLLGSFGALREPMVKLNHNFSLNLLIAALSGL